MDSNLCIGVHFNVFLIDSSDKEDMNKKLLVIPTIVLSSALLLTGCTSGKSEPGKTGAPNPSSSSSSNVITDTSSQPISGYVTPPAKMDANYKAFYMAPMTLDEESWAHYKEIGAKTYEEDPATRPTTKTDWEAARDDKKDFNRFDKIFGEVTSDIEHSALNVSHYLETKPSVSIDELNSNKELLINRYTNVGEMKVEKDSNTGFFFITFKMKENKDAPAYGILVPQKGVTPNFDVTSSK